MQTKSGSRSTRCSTSINMTKSFQVSLISRAKLRCANNTPGLFAALWRAVSAGAYRAPWWLRLLTQSTIIMWTRATILLRANGSRFHMKKCQGALEMKITSKIAWWMSPKNSRMSNRKRSLLKKSRSLKRSCKLRQRSMKRPRKRQRTRSCLWKRLMKKKEGTDALIKRVARMRVTIQRLSAASISTSFTNIMSLRSYCQKIVTSLSRRTR